MGGGWGTQKSTNTHLQESFTATLNIDNIAYVSYIIYALKYQSGINKPKCVFRAIQNAIKKILRNLKITSAFKKSLILKRGKDTSNKKLWTSQ